MPTDAQTEANRINAQYSTGPKTDVGKQASSRNATKHGIFSKRRVLATESLVKYEAFRAAMIADLAPEGEEENILVDEIIGIHWRLQRVELAEMELLERDLFATRTEDLNIFSLYTSRLIRSRAVLRKQLDALQQKRNEREQEQLAEAAVIRRSDIAANRPTDPTEFGFVFSLDFVDRYIRRQDALTATPARPNSPNLRRAA